MIIEIYGAGSSNKGAYLMILAVQKALKEHYGNVTFAVDPTEQIPFIERAKHELHYIYSLEPLYRRGRRLLRKATLLTDNWVSPRQKKLFGLVTRADCDALIDVSGYRYGDFWKAGGIKIFGDLATYYRKRGKPVIMLPQMFGPFEQADTKAAFARALKEVSLVYARDPISEATLKENFEVGGKLRTAPDFTIPLGHKDLSRERIAYIVPNSKVFSKPDVGGEQYLQCMQTAYESFLSHGIICRLLIFDGAEQDKRLLDRLAQRLKVNPDEAIVTESDPLRLKAMLGAATLIFSSRFHACVCGLSSNVPVLTYGWAHKYQALHEDFNVPELIIGTENPAGDVANKINTLISQPETVQRKLAEANKELTAKNERMWNEVFTFLDNSAKEP